MKRSTAPRPKQLEALVSPIRLEIVEALELHGPCSIAEIAAELERTPHSLYHHFRRLAEVGLIAEVDSRRSGARDQALYDVLQRPVIVERDISTSLARRQRVRATGQLLRSAERDYEAALDGAAHDAHEAPEVRSYRVRLADESIARIRGHLDAIVEVILAERLRACDPAPGSRWIRWIDLLALRAPASKR